MRVFGHHCDETSLTTGVACAHAGEKANNPAMRVTVEFLLRNGNVSQLTILGLVDTGAAMTIVPGYLLGLSISHGSTFSSADAASTAPAWSPAGQMDFEPIFLTGVLGSGLIPGYRAYVTVGGRRLKNDILVGAVVGRYQPLIGRDVLDQGILMIDPWRTTSAIAAKGPGRLLSLVLSRLKGRCVGP